HFLQAIKATNKYESKFCFWSAVYLNGERATHFRISTPGSRTSWDWKWEWDGWLGGQLLFNSSLGRVFVLCFWLLWP
ncbi:hypothetical protein M5D96_008758, partial [Drosophila gunungcola]